MRRRHAVGAGLAALAVSLVLAGFGSARAADRHAGYYYPKPQTIETYDARISTMKDANRRRRVAFVVGMANVQLSRPYPPEYAMFAKGLDAEKLIIVGNEPGRLNTIYRVRALLATLTSVARALPIFREVHGEDTLTFFDLAKMMGFEQITISDGDTFAHQVILK